MNLSADVEGEYLVQLEVTDGYTSVSDTARLTLEPNKAPIAHIDVTNAADPYQQGDWINLDAGLSADAEGDQLNFTWELIEQPAGANTIKPITYGVGDRYTTIQTREVGQHKIQLVANDGELDSAPVTKTFVVVVRNSIPIASASVPTQLSMGKLSTFDAAQSFDEDNDPLTYSWSTISTPANSTASLVGANSVQADFIPDLEGEYQIQLVVNDGKNDSVPLVLTINSIDDNKQPEAFASYSHAVIVDDKVSISGWASDDEDSDPLTYSWLITQKPNNSQAMLDNANIMAPTFIADQAGSYTFQLIVNDGLVNSEPHSITITATVDRVGLPDHPGETGKQTLLGIDDDNDGVRDDIQRQIYATYPDDSQENLRLALTEMAKTYQTILWEAMDPNQAYGNAIDMGLHQECLAFLVSDASYQMTTKLKSEILDTKDRFEAYLAYDSALAGEIFPTSKIEDFKNSCSFQLN